MKIAVMQPYIFPYLGYFQLINAVDKFIIYDDVNFIKKGWINRNYILINSKSKLFSIPLQKASQNKLINEIHIIETNKWKSDFLKTISYNYKKAPFFKDFYKILEKIINYNEINLELFVFYSIQEICNYLEIKTEFLKSSQIIKNNNLKGENKIIDICLALKATDYINPIGGIDLYDKSFFSNNKLNLYFIKPDITSYKQFENEFVPGLSIIDFLMFNSIDDTVDKLNKFELI